MHPRDPQVSRGPQRFTLVELSPSGGLFQFSFQLGTHLAARGHTVELVTGPDPELTSDRANFRVMDVLPTWHSGSAGIESRMLRKARRLLRACRHLQALVKLLGHVERRRPDVLIWHAMRFPIDSWLVIVARRRYSSVLMGVVLHEPRPLAEQRKAGSLYRSNNLIDRSLAAAVRSMDVIFVLGEQARDYVRGEWDPPGTLTVIPHGDEAVFLADDGVPPAEKTPPKILFFGTWTRHKGIDVLLTAFDQLRERVPHAELVIAGAVGADIDYNAIARRAGPMAGVRLRPGYVPIPEVSALMAEARVVAVPYLRANQSGVVHLAQTFGRPVVASNVGDIPAVVPHEVAGLIVPPNDPTALADALARFLDDPITARRMGESGRERLRSESSWSDIAAEVSAAAAHAALQQRPATRR